METALRLESIRSAKRVAENSRSSSPSIAAISNKFQQLNPKAGAPADPLPPFALAEYRQSCWSATGADGAPPPGYTEPTRNRAELEMPESDPSTAIQITKVELLAQRSRLDVTKATGLCATSNAQLKIILSVDDMVSEELLTLSNRYLRGETTDEERLIHAACALSLCGFGSVHVVTLGSCSGAARSLALLSSSLSSSPGDDDRSSWRCTQKLGYVSCFPQVKTVSVSEVVLSSVSSLDPALL
jgi:hypothetical protein